MTLLIVDDDNALREVLARALSNTFGVVEQADSVDRALELNTEFSHAIIDLNMPDKNGLELIAPLKQRCPDCRILILTGYSSIATAVEAMRRGAHHYLCKPINIAQIKAGFEDNPESQSPDEAHRPSLDRVEWEHIQQALKDHDGNVSATARSLGMHRRTLQRKLSKKPVGI